MDHKKLIAKLKSFPQSKTPITCLLKTSQLSDLHDAMHLIGWKDFSFAKWRNCSDEEKERLFPPDANRLSMLFTSPYTKEQLEQMEWMVAMDPGIREERRQAMMQSLLEDGFTEDEIYGEIISY